MWAITAGFFFGWLASPSRATNAPAVDRACQQFPAPSGHRMKIQPEKLRQFPIAPMTQLMRLQPGIETPLALIQQTVEQKDGGFQFWQRCRRQQRFLDRPTHRSRFPLQALLPLARGLPGQVHIDTADLPSLNSLLPVKMQQRLFRLDVQECF